MKTNKCSIKIRAGLKILLLCLTTSINAQDGWNSPTNGEGPFVNSPTHLDYKSGESQRHSWHRVYWYENITDREQTTNYHDKSKKIEGNCADGGRIVYNWDATSPCYNSSDVTDLESGTKLNYSQVHFREGNSLCLKFEEKWGDLNLFPIKIPVFSPPLPTLGEYYTCPDGSVEITVDIQSDGIFQENPNFVQWKKVDPVTQQSTIIFTDHNILPQLKSTLKTNIGTNPADIQNFEVFAAKNYNGCIVEGEPMLISVTSSAGAPLNPPQPQVFTSCNPQQYSITIPNEYNYDGVFWYNNLTDANGPIGSLHDGFSYNYKTSGAIETLYVEYYKQLESGCYIRSPRVPITFVSSPAVGSNVTLDRNVIFDYRDFNEPDCNVSRNLVEEEITPYYYDLPNPEGLTLTEDLVNEFDLQLNEGCNNFKLFHSEPIWTVVRGSDLNTISDFNKTTNNLNETVYRVCAENISSIQGKYGYKDYEIVIKIQGELTLCNGDPDEAIPINCSIRAKSSRTRVSTREPGEITSICNFPSDPIFNSLSNTDPNCSRKEYETVCPNNTPTTLGPTEEEILTFFQSQSNIVNFDPNQLKYQWTPTSGLSDATIANPIVTFNSIPKPIGQIQKYYLKVTYDGMVLPFTERPEYNMCSYVYKCSSCGHTGGPGGLLGNN